MHFFSLFAMINLYKNAAISVVWRWLPDSAYQISSVYVAGNPVEQKENFLHHHIGKVLEQWEQILARTETGI